MKHNIAISMDLNTKLFFTSFRVFFFSILTTSLGTIVDGLVIGNTMTVTAVAAYGLIAPMNYFFALVGSLLNSGIMTLCTRALGQNKKEEAQGIFSMAFFTGLFLSVMGALAIIFFARPILILLKATPGTELFELSREYLIAYVLGLPAITTTKLLSSIMQLDGDPKRALASVVTMTAVNISGDLICVKLFHSNLTAIAAVTAFSYYAGLFVLLLHFLKKNIIFKIVFHNLQWKQLPLIVQYGLPKAFSRITSSISNITINMALVEVSTVAVAGYSVVQSVSFVINAVVFGVGQAMMFLISLYYGEKNKKGILKILKLSLIAQALLTFLVFILVTLFSRTLAHLYLGQNQEAYSAACSALFWGAFGTIFSGLNILLADYLQVIKQILPANLVYFLENVVYLIACVSYARGFHRAAAIYVGIFVSHLLMTLTIPMFVRVVSGKKIKSSEDLLLLEENFGVSPEDEVFFAVQNLDQVMEASSRVLAFYKEKGLSQRNSMILSLMVEELGTNVVTYGFQKRNHLSIRSIYKDQVCTLIFRDDCDYFDPVERFRFLKDSSTDTNIGIRMVMNLAKNVTYSSACGLNNLIIEV